MRSRKPGRLSDIAAAACAVFTRQGFRLTQMSDVARQAGISAGALYSYVDGKEALFELALDHALGRSWSEDARFQAKGLAQRLPGLGERLAAEVAWPALRAASEQPGVDETACRAVFAELHELVGRHRQLIWLLDRCSGEFPELAGLYETIVRGRYIAELTRLIARAPALADASDEHVRATARALMEMTVWMGMHRLRDRQPPDIDDAAAASAAIDIALHRLVPGRA